MLSSEVEFYRLHSYAVDYLSDMIVRNNEGLRKRGERDLHCLVQQLCRLHKNRYTAFMI